jgi:hypothetical protein
MLLIKYKHYAATNHIFHSRIWSYHNLVEERGEEVDHQLQLGVRA